MEQLNIETDVDFNHKHCIMCQTVSVPEIGARLPVAEYVAHYRAGYTSGVCDCERCRCDYVIYTLGEETCAHEPGLLEVVCQSLHVDIQKIRELLRK